MSLTLKRCALAFALALVLASIFMTVYQGPGFHHGSPAYSTGGDESFMKKDSSGNPDSLLVVCDKTYFNAHAVGKWVTNYDSGYKRDPDGAGGDCGRLDFAGNGTRHQTCSGKDSSGYWGCGSWSLH